MLQHQIAQLNHTFTRHGYMRFHMTIIYAMCVTINRNTARKVNYKNETRHLDLDVLEMLGYSFFKINIIVLQYQHNHVWKQLRLQLY